MNIGLVYCVAGLIYIIGVADWELESEESQIRQFFERVAPQATIQPQLKEKLRKHIRLMGPGSLAEFKDPKQLMKFE